MVDNKLYNVQIHYASKNKLEKKYRNTYVKSDMMTPRLTRNSLSLSMRFSSSGSSCPCEAFHDVSLLSRLSSPNKSGELSSSILSRPYSLATLICKEIN